MTKRVVHYASCSAVLMSCCGTYLRHNVKNGKLVEIAKPRPSTSDLKKVTCKRCLAREGKR